MRRTLPQRLSNIYEKDIPVNINRADILYYKRQLRELRCRIPMVYVDGISQYNPEMKAIERIEGYIEDYLYVDDYEMQAVISNLEGYYFRIPTLHDFITLAEIDDSVDKYSDKC